MTAKTKKPFYGFVALVSSIIIAMTFVMLGILVFYFFSNLIGLIILCIGLYSLSSYLASIYLINPYKSLDLSNILELKGDELVLDVGCGLGRATIGIAKLLNSGRVIGVDVWDKIEIPGNSVENANKNAESEGVKEKVEFQFGDAFDLPFDDEHFDVVISAGCITSFYNDDEKIKVLKEIRRVLKTDGTFYLREPTLQIKTFIILTPSILLIRLPTKNHWIELLEKSDFKNITYLEHNIASSYITSKTDNKN